MAYDKIVDSTALDTALTDIADAIRTKTGKTDPLTLAQMPSEIEVIETGSSSVPESDPREVYQGTRPAEWLRLPDYDSVEENTIYFLLKLFPYGENIVKFAVKCTGDCTISAGEVSNGAFVQYADDTPVSVTGIGGYGDVTISRSFEFANYPQNQMADGGRQIVVKLSAPSGIHRIGYGGVEYHENSGITDMVINCRSSAFVFNVGVNNYSCQYYYVFQGQISNFWTGAEYVKSATNICIPNQRLYLSNLRSFLGTVKLGNYAETFRDCRRLETLECDISEITAWNNAFYTYAPCRSLRRLTFIGGENLTSFPGDIYLGSTNLTATEVLAFFNTLPDISTSDTRTITLTSTPAVSEGIPDDTLAVATNKGWTVVTA